MDLEQPTVGATADDQLGVQELIHRVSGDAQLGAHRIHQVGRVAGDDLDR